MGIILAILLFSAIVIFHELGHFTLAKLNGIRVDEFSLGLGKTLFGKQIGETKFSVKLLPFGGACMMGEDDAEDVLDGSFNSKSVWARMSVIVAGPVFNFIMALAFATIIIAWIGYDAPVVAGVEQGYAAAEQGMKSGDVIKKLNGKNVHLWKEISLANLMNFDAEPMELTYERAGKETTITLEPRQLKEDYAPRMGFYSSGEYTKANFFESVQYGVYTLKYWIHYTFESIKMLCTGKIGFNQLSGPIGIMNKVDDIYKEASPEGWQIILLNLLNLAVFISANLGVMNLLPIPALDGGRLVFLLIEAIRGKRIAPEKEAMVNEIGFRLLMALMIVVLVQDIIRLF